MKLELKVTGERVKEPTGTFAYHREMESEAYSEAYTVAEANAEGDAELIAGHLRAVADSISPRKPALRDLPTMEAQR